MFPEPSAHPRRAAPLAVFFRLVPLDVVAEIVAAVERQNNFVELVIGTNAFEYRCLAGRTAVRGGQVPERAAALRRLLVPHVGESALPFDAETGSERVAKDADPPLACLLALPRPLSKSVAVDRPFDVIVVVSKSPGDVRWIGTTCGAGGHERQGPSAVLVEARRGPSRRAQADLNHGNARHQRDDDENRPCDYACSAHSCTACAH